VRKVEGIIKPRPYEEHFNWAECRECGELLFTYYDFVEHINKQRHNKYVVLMRARREKLDSKISNLDYAAAYEEMLIEYDERKNTSKILSHKIVFIPCGNYAYCRPLPKPITL